MLSPQRREAVQLDVYTPPMLRVGPLTIAAIWSAAGLLLGWAYLAERWRRLLALAVSLLGLVFLIVAINSEGLHEAPGMTEVLGRPYLLPATTASASLPFYVLTAACLVLGLTGLALGERAVLALRRRCVWSAIGLASALALLRFGLERAAAPQALARLVGVNWLAPVVGVLLYLNLPAGAPGRARAFARELALYALGSRAAIVALYVLATSQGLGTHYDVAAVDHLSFPRLTLQLERGSSSQFALVVLVPQLLWALYTLVAGTLGALLAHCALALHARPRPRARSGPPAPEPLDDAGLQAPPGVGA